MNVLSNPIQFVQTNDFHIQLETDHIVLHGNVDESAGVMLRGTVVFHPQETTKVRNVHLKFYGKAKVNWAEGKKVTTNKQSFYCVLSIDRYRVSSASFQE